MFSSYKSVSSPPAMMRPLSPRYLPPGGRPRSRGEPPRPPIWRAPLLEAPLPRWSAASPSFHWSQPRRSRMDPQPSPGVSLHADRSAAAALRLGQPFRRLAYRSRRTAGRDRREARRPAMLGNGGMRAITCLCVTMRPGSGLLGERQQAPTDGGLRERVPGKAASAGDVQPAPQRISPARAPVWLNIILVSSSGCCCNPPP